MVELSRLVAFLDEHLEASRYADVAMNGLQVQGRPVVRRVALGASASLALFERALGLEADAVLVHHGLFWGKPAPIVGPLAGRLRLLLENELSLVAYHIPLDAHPEDGNNARLARALGLTDLEPWGEHHGRTIGWLGVPEGGSIDALAARVAEVCGASPLTLGAQPPRIHRVAVCTGSGGSMVGQAIAAGADALVTGEPGEPAQELAREAGIAVLGAGHYNTERLGVEALGARLAATFGIEPHLVDVPNPV